MTDKPKRAGTMSDDERAEVGRPHRSPVRGVPVFVVEEDSANYEGAELKEMRSQRPTDKRLEKLEEKHDLLDEKVDAIHGDVREMRGELKTALGFMQGAQVQVGETVRARISTNGKIIIAIVGAAITTIGTIVVAVLA